MESNVTLLPYAEPSERRGAVMTIDPDPVVAFEDVHLAFKGIRAIDGVSFTVGRRELFAIIGPNGAGKTSIFNVLSGVYRPQRGRVVFDGADLVGKRPHQIAAAGMARTSRTWSCSPT